MALSREDHPPTVRDLTPRVMALMVILLIMGLGTLWFTLSNSNTSEAVLDGNAVTACRGESFALLVSDLTDVVAANSEQVAAKARLDVVTNEALEASYRQDDATFERLVAEAPALREEVVSKEEKVQATIKKLERDQEGYLNAVSLSVSDPEKFLADCRD